MAWELTEQLEQMAKPEMAAEDVARQEVLEDQDHSQEVLEVEMVELEVREVVELRDVLEVEIMLLME